MTAPTFVPDRKHLRADALIALAGLLARDRVTESAGLWYVDASSENVLVDIVAGLDNAIQSAAADGTPLWSGHLLGQLLYVRLVPEPSMAELASALLTPDAALTPGGVA